MYKLVPENKRLETMPKYFKKDVSLMMHFEEMVYVFARKLLGKQYFGGYWEFYETKDGFFMAPGYDGDNKNYLVSSPNGNSHSLPRIETGVVICSFALSNTSFHAHTEKLDYSLVSDLYWSLKDNMFVGKYAIEMFILID